MTITLSVPQTEGASALRLRPWRFDDLSFLVAAHRDPGLHRWLASRLADETDARNWVAAQVTGWADATRFSFAVVVDDDDHSLVGHVVVKMAMAGVAEVGYWTAAHARGRGVAARALETASRWALAEQDLVQLNQLELLHARDNHASCRVANKCGYTLQDLLPAAPPRFPGEGHRHVRRAGASPI
ncbi:GNAT family N-acetyltransferase [Nocardia iowensis]|uniref:GNAT family N-acetyltransferase n=1 Tax=Nocardia iowensis TaxID=204891 RepID=A0ABX8RU22_NOCIO|nr:GNAT family N-acetyltransferase [Nocardia iowensis]QXN93142.1 GNAT family N-acetyltransferase [Nocardia iowensis]